MHLPQVGMQLGERRALGGVARERVDDLLDVLQVGEDLLRDLGAQLQRADALGEVGAQARGRLAGRLAVRGVEQPPAHDHDLRLEVRGRLAEMVDHVLDEEERRGHLDHHHLGVARVRVGQLCRHQRDGVDQLDQVLVAEVLGLALEVGDALAEDARLVALAADVLLPGALERVEPGVHVEQRVLQALGIELKRGVRLLAAREQALELVELLDLLDARRGRLASRERVQHLAQQRVAVLGRAAREVADLEVEPVAHHLRGAQPFRVPRQLLLERVDQRAGRPPQRARLGQLGGHLVQARRRSGASPPGRRGRRAARPAVRAGSACAAPAGTPSAHPPARDSGWGAAAPARSSRGRTGPFPRPQPCREGRTRRGRPGTGAAARRPGRAPARRRNSSARAPRGRSRRSSRAVGRGRRCWQSCPRWPRTRAWRRSGRPCAAPRSPGAGARGRAQHRLVLRRGGELGDRILDERQRALDFGVDPGQEGGVVLI